MTTVALLGLFGAVALIPLVFVAVIVVRRLPGHAKNRDGITGGPLDIRGPAALLLMVGLGLPLGLAVAGVLLVSGTYYS